jgi:hypothetical protein
MPVQKNKESKQPIFDEDLGLDRLPNPLFLVLELLRLCTEIKLKRLN